MTRDPQRASRETLEQLASADDAWYGSTTGEPEPHWHEESKRHFLALQRYRAETHGPPGAAAKESREDIAAPGEATTSCHPSTSRAPRTAGARTPGEPSGVLPTAPEESVRAGGGSLEERVARLERQVQALLTLKQIQEVTYSIEPEPVEPRWQAAPGAPDERPCGCEETFLLKECIRRAKIYIHGRLAIPHEDTRVLIDLLNGDR